MKSRVILEHSRRDPIRLMCRALAVSAAGSYAWRMRPESRRAGHNRILLSEIRRIHREARETYGSPSIWDALVKRGHGVGENRIARLMRVEGIRAKTVKKWHATTDPDHTRSVATNILNRQFQVEQPNRVWAGDLTYVWTTEGWLYLAVVLDLYSRIVIGWAMGHRLTVDLAERALTMALTHRKPTAGLLHHSDRGSQGGFKWSSQHLDAGGCDEHSKAAFGSGWAATLAVTRSTAGGRRRGAATVLGGDRGRHGE